MWLILFCRVNDKELVTLQPLGFFLASLIGFSVCLKDIYEG